MAHSPLDEACRRNADPKDIVAITIQLLQREDIVPHAMLNCVCRFGYWGAAFVLLRAGVDPNKKIGCPPRRLCPMELAVLHRHYKIVQLLIAHGATYSFTTDRSRTFGTIFCRAETYNPAFAATIAVALVPRLIIGHWRSPR